jgi:uncharacterized protein YcgI (DUF1989 family)
LQYCHLWLAILISPVSVTLRLSDYQLAVIEPLLDPAPGARQLDALVARAIAYDAARGPDPHWSGTRPAGRAPSPPGARGDVDVVLPAGSAAAVGLAPGAVLRVEQLVEGQCVDLDAFAPAPPGQRFSAARTRMLNGLRPTTGATLWSTPPELPLLEIVADSCPGHDLAFPPCSPFEYEQLAGVRGHPSCVELQLAARRGCGHGAAGVHDVLNLWLPSETTAEGQLRAWPVACRRGDYVELRALRDVIVVLCPCPDDLFGSSQYEPGPVRVLAGGDGGAELTLTAVKAPPRMHERTIALPDELDRHLRAVQERGWLGYDRAAVARALLLRYAEARGPARRP